MRLPSALLGVSALLNLFSLAFAKLDCATRISTCIERGRGKPVCGTDNQTYPTRCELLRQHCEAGTVAVKYRGPCKEAPCWSADPVDGHSPRCLSDGRYAPVQCHPRTGECWCVSAAGEVLPHSTIRNGRLRCPRRASGKTRRGSLSREKHRKDCSRIDRSTFVTNLVRVFRGEYSRQPHVVVNESEDALESDRRALEWKFNALDVDGDSRLSRVEHRVLRELVRHSVKPRRCARTFGRHCDPDGDTFITHHEWTTCLGLDANLLQESIGALAGGPLQFGEDSGDRKDETEVISDCMTDRQAVLDEMRTNSNEMYIPECTPDGRYQKKQCYHSTGYCWCVNEDSGNTIPGTSVKDVDPKCDTVQPLVRPMKGCPEHRKQAFLRGLMDFLTHTMVSQKTSNITNLDMSQEEQIAAWNFHALDTNKNKVLEKSEWKAFRSLISTHRKLRRCGKKLPRYCDINHDRIISLTEWLTCLNAQRPVADASAVPTPNPRRKGKNPLESYLMGDD